MRLENKDYEKAKQIVADIIYDYDLKYPIDIIDLAEKMGFSVIPYSFYKDLKNELYKMSYDGFNWFNEKMNTFNIYYNDDIESNSRINFTIAHEIGHIVLDCNDNSEESNSLVDFFAAYLLAPVILIIDKNMKTVEEIKNFFGISYEAAENSLKRANSRLNCGFSYTNYEEYIIMSQK